MPQTIKLSKTRQLTFASLLTAIGIIIPIVMPLKIVIPPASYTLASHVAIFVAMFISPFTAVLVSLGTSLGFQLAGFPLIIVARAASHVVFAYVGAKMLQQRPEWLSTTSNKWTFSVIINIVHAAAEVAVVFFLTQFGLSTASENFLYVLIVLVGGGTVIHGMVDYFLSDYFAKQLATRAKIPVYPTV
ncbi:hypothetical protein [Facklamia sp. 7083-14-GEN3]|uniref:hypothetical protein n=1 Tax=Facklamia sp. 7083-14-GEN3 TaxID=2973478 RepID=UPI00215BE1E2|nr:hypothetical protein [Facklamia sp. 7083-14-GEN3]MCR8969585.1 hypothetical protein [Facklamia sp. 7083-14-GEN3]